MIVTGLFLNWRIKKILEVVIREIIISGLREFLAKVSISVPVSRLAKIKSFFQMLAISILLTGDSGNKFFNFYDYNASDIGIILLWLSAFLTLYTGYGYMAKGIDKAFEENN